MKAFKIMTLAATLASCLCANAHAQTYPGSKPVKFIVPFPPGGGTDILSRVIGQKMQEAGYAIVIDNKGGAGGNIGADAAAKSPADGYTIVMGQTSNLAINPGLYAKMPFDPLKDLEPIVLVAQVPSALVVRADSPHRALGDLVAADKAKPDTVTMASAGNGTVGHLSGELFKQAASARFVHVPYKGAGQAMTDLLGGSVDFGLASIPIATSQIKGGKIRALGVTSAARVKSLPDVPAIAELGYPGFDALSWYGILVPAGTPKAIVEKLNEDLNRILRSPEVVEKIEAEGGIVMGGSAQSFADLMRADTTRWGKIIKDAGAKLD